LTPPEVAAPESSEPDPRRPMGITPPGKRDRPMSWDRYAELVEQRWRALLASKPKAELELQNFLELHPCLLPFALAYTPAGEPAYGHHGTIHGAVFSQPRLPGAATDLRPDFMRITRSSSWVEISLFELKGARLRMFRADGRFRDAFDAARAQLQGYASWLDDPHNWPAFKKAYQIPAYVDFRDFRLRLVLLSGRRDEVYAHPVSRDLRRREGEVISRSLDSLVPDANARDDITVRRARGRLVAQHVQPTMRYGPGNADGLAGITGLADAIERQPEIGPKRRAFLLDRLPYWQHWATAEGLHVHPAGYWE
jgi:hypothetical protein